MRAIEGYEQLVDRVRALVCEVVPAGASVLLVSRGDSRLLDVPGRRAAHFPQAPSGTYAGHYPADGSEARRQLLHLRATGAGYIAFPDTGRWWLDHYPELRDWLARNGRVLADRVGTAVIFALDRDCPVMGDAAAAVAPHIGSLAAALLPPGAPLVVIGPPGAGAAVTDRCVLEVAPGTPWPDAGNTHYAVVVDRADPSILPMARRLICRRHVFELYALDA